MPDGTRWTTRKFYPKIPCERYSAHIEPREREFAYSPLVSSALVIVVVGAKFIAVAAPDIWSTPVLSLTMVELRSAVAQL